jgi:hypothetical protein
MPSYLIAKAQCFVKFYTTIPVCYIALILKSIAIILATGDWIEKQKSIFLTI